MTSNPTVPQNNTPSVAEGPCSSFLLIPLLHNCEVVTWQSRNLVSTLSKQKKKNGLRLSELRVLFAVPQGSALGLLFSLYTTPLSKVIGRHLDINFNFYADDTQLFVHMSDKTAALVLDKLNSCLWDVQEWITSTMLVLNTDKRVHDLWASCSAHEIRCSPSCQDIFNFMHPAVVLKNLGVWFNANFSFADQVCYICKTLFK